MGYQENRNESEVKYLVFLNSGNNEAAFICAHQLVTSRKYMPGVFGEVDESYESQVQAVIFIIILMAHWNSCTLYYHSMAGNG